MLIQEEDSIVAKATPSGKGGIGVIRISGHKVLDIALSVFGLKPKERYVHYASFRNNEGVILDQGLVLFFRGPHSFTGEDVLEFHGHGGVVLMNMLITHLLTFDNIRLAKPGEFSERAFLNDKIDLTQAEAIADLIDASSEYAVKGALSSLQGEFAKKVNNIVDEVTYLRVYVEAAIDFPEEEIDFFADRTVIEKLDNIKQLLHTILQQSEQSLAIKEGVNLALAGKPNAGKSSLLNAFVGSDKAIVTDVAGTTRDIISEQIFLDGLPVNIIDTAGIRESTDKVERIGIEKALDAVKKADIVLLVIDVTDWCDYQIPEWITALSDKVKVFVVQNKIDLATDLKGLNNEMLNQFDVFSLSVKNKVGIEELKLAIQSFIGYNPNNESLFIARKRHIEALKNALEHLLLGIEQLMVHHAGELLAEELKCVQLYLSEITGAFSSDDLLGKIFSSFCIGK